MRFSAEWSTPYGENTPILISSALVVSLADTRRMYSGPYQKLISHQNGIKRIPTTVKSRIPLTASRT